MSRGSKTREDTPGMKCTTEMGGWESEREEDHSGDTKKGAYYLQQSVRRVTMALRVSS